MCSSLSSQLKRNREFQRVTCLQACRRLMVHLCFLLHCHAICIQSLWTHTHTLCESLRTRRWCDLSASSPSDTLQFFFSLAASDRCFSRDELWSPEEAIYHNSAETRPHFPTCFLTAFFFCGFFINPRRGPAVIRQRGLPGFYNQVPEWLARLHPSHFHDGLSEPPGCLIGLIFINTTSPVWLLSAARVCFVTLRRGVHWFFLSNWVCNQCKRREFARRAAGVLAFN